MPGWDGTTVRDRTANIDCPKPQKDAPEYGARYVSYFWGMRRFLSADVDVITPDLVRQWGQWSGISLSRREESIIYTMDSAFRQVMPKITAHHEARRQRESK